MSSVVQFSHPITTTVVQLANVCVLEMLPDMIVSLVERLKVCTADADTD